MAKQLQLRRGTTAQHSTFAGANGEVTIDTDKGVVVVHNGSGTAGSGKAMIKETDTAYTIATVNDFSTVPSDITTVIVKEKYRGGVFNRIDSTTANDGTIFSGTGYSWIRQYSGAVNVKWFGAKDGEDNTFPIKAAISYAESIYKDIKITVDLAECRHNISSTIIFNGTKVSIQNGSIKSLSSGTYTDNSIFKVTDDGGQVVLGAYKNIAKPVFKDLLLEDEAGTLDCIYAYDTSSDSNNAASSLHTVTTTRFTNFDKVFKNGKSGWGWQFIACGATGCNYWLFINNSANTYERYNFYGCIFQNGGKVLYLNNPDGKVYWTDGSIDYCDGLGDVVQGYVELNTHIEFGDRFSSGGGTWCTITTGKVDIKGGLIALREEGGGSPYYLFTQGSDYQVSVDNLVVLTDGTNVGNFSNKRFKTNNIHFENLTSGKYFFCDFKHNFGDMREITANVYGTGMSITTQNATNIVATSSVGAGSEKGVTLTFDVPYTHNYVAWKFTASSTSNTYINKYEYVFNELVGLSFSLGDVLINSTLGIKDTDGQMHFIGNEFRKIKLSINCFLLSAGQTLNISDFYIYTF